ncbi:hypothetical protein SprV_0501909700 [Sparganum proliferum]
MANWRFLDSLSDSDDEWSTSNIEDNPPTPTGVSNGTAFLNHNLFNSEGTTQVVHRLLSGFGLGESSPAPDETVESTNGGHMPAHISSSRFNCESYDSNCFSSSVLVSPEVEESQPFFSITPIQAMQRSDSYEVTCDCDTTGRCDSPAPNFPSAHDSFPPIVTSQNVVSVGHHEVERSSWYNSCTNPSSPDSRYETAGSLRPSSPPTQFDVTGDIRTANLLLYDQWSAGPFATQS